MGSLRDLLKKQKEQGNVATKPATKSVLQPETVKSGAETKSPGTIQQEIKDIQETKRNEQSGGSSIPAVVEPRPLTALEKIKAAKAAKESGQSPKQEKPKEPIAKQIEQSAKPIEALVAPAPDKHEQKTNDGKIDTSELKRNLEYLANNIEQKELVGQVVRTIALQLKQTPELTPYMTDADVDLVVRGLRRSYSIVARKKSEAAEKRKGFGKNTDELSAMFKDAGLDGLDLGLK